MNDDRFDELMRDARDTYRNPPQPDFEAMWKDIERAHFGGTVEQPIRGTERGRFWMVTNRWVGIAATLMVGIGLGRMSAKVGPEAGVSPTPIPVVAAAPSSEVRDTTMARPYELEASQFLGQTAALLISLPSETRNGRPDQKFATRAGELLTRTRLLMDSPAANDPAMRGLLEDLELVLAQVVRLEGGNRTDLDLINRALEQRDVIPRLRTAVADISAN
jgi:hypothetical protein